eukprot:2111306-Alexandrium_andersonii.AAC.1
MSASLVGSEMCIRDRCGEWCVVCKRARRAGRARHKGAGHKGTGHKCAERERKARGASLQGAGLEV